MKTISLINTKIKKGEAVVVTADEMTEIVKSLGPEKAAQEVDVVTTPALIEKQALVHWQREWRWLSGG